MKPKENARINLRKLAGFACVVCAALSMALVFFTKFDDIFFISFFIFILAAFLLLPEYRLSSRECQKLPIVDTQNPQNPHYRAVRWHK